MRSRMFLRLALGAFALLLVAGGVAVGLLVRHDRSQPVCELGAEQPVDGYAVNTLRCGDRLYRSGPVEFALLPVDESFRLPWQRQVGKTADGTGQVVIRPKGQVGDDYVVLTGGEMMGETVFRDAGLPATGLKDLGLSVLDLSESRGGPPSVRRSEDPALIDAAIAALGGAGVPAGDLAGVTWSRLKLSSPRLPGLYYLVSVVVDGQGSVYLARRGEENVRWLPLSGQLLDWLRPAASSPS